MAGELEVAVAAAVAAGEILRSNFDLEQKVRYKGEVDLVTEVDEQAERKIGGCSGRPSRITACSPRRAAR